MALKTSYLDSLFSKKPVKTVKPLHKQFEFTDDEQTTIITLSNTSTLFNGFVSMQRKNNGSCVDYSSGFACLDSPKENARDDNKNPRCASLISLKMFVDLFEDGPGLAIRLEEKGIELIKEWIKENQRVEKKGCRSDCQLSFPIASESTPGRMGRPDVRSVLEMRINSFAYTSKNQFVDVPAPMRIRDLKVRRRFYFLQCSFLKSQVSLLFSQILLLLHINLSVPDQTEDNGQDRVHSGQVFVG